MSSRDKVREIMQESKDKLNKIADEHGEADDDDWAGLEGRGINADLIGPPDYYNNTKTAAKVTHTYMNQYKGQNEAFKFLGDYHHGIPDNGDGEPSGDKVLTSEGNEWCRFNGGILSDTKKLIGNVSDSVFIRNKSTKGRCLPVEYARSQVNGRDTWPVQDNNGTLNKKGRPCVGAKHIKYNIANNSFDCYYEDLDKQTLSTLYNRKGYNKQHADTAKQVIKKYCSHPENRNKEITTNKTCEDMIDEYDITVREPAADDDTDAQEPAAAEQTTPPPEIATMTGGGFPAPSAPSAPSAPEPAADVDTDTTEATDAEEPDVDIRCKKIKKKSECKNTPGCKYSKKKKKCKDEEDDDDDETVDDTDYDTVDETDDDTVDETDDETDDDETDDDETDDEEDDDEEDDDEEDDDEEDDAALLEAAAKAKAAKEKEEEEAAAEQQKLFALIALVVLLLFSSSAAAAFFMFKK